MKHDDSLNMAFSCEIRPFIDVIDSIRRIGIQEDVSLPKVVVVGDQSSGKSSIIEALSGVQLPRGKGIVTRCPLELQLMRVLNSPWMAKLSYQSKEGLLVEHRIYSPTSVEEYIRQAQDNICGVGKGVSDRIITLRIESPSISAPDLTLIDLPGIARIALADQAYDICDQIRRTIMGYIKPKNTVILCVISAMLDIAVNESIKIAREVDPYGERTIGVFTKADLADESQKQELICALNGERIHLAKGFSMVKCRCQKELDEMLLLDISKLGENDFFAKDEIYRNANKNQLGVTNLAIRISEELLSVIKTCLPQLKENVDSLSITYQCKLDSLPPPVPCSAHQKRALVSSNIGNLTDGIKRLVYHGIINSVESNMYLTFRVYSERFRAAVKQKSLDAYKTRFSLSKMSKLIADAKGQSCTLNFNYELFQNLATSVVSTFREDAKEFAKSTNHIVEKSIMLQIEEAFEYLPLIYVELKAILRKISQKSLSETEKEIDFIFEKEKFAFTMNVSFERYLENIQLKQILNTKLKLTRTASLDVIKKENSSTMRTVIRGYLKIAEKRLCDVIPMTVHFCSIIRLNSQLSQRFAEFATSSGIEDKVTEKGIIFEQRRLLSEKIERLNNAQIQLFKL